MPFIIITAAAFLGLGGIYLFRPDLHERLHAWRNRLEGSDRPYHRDSRADQRLGGAICLGGALVLLLYALIYR